MEERNSISVACIGLVRAMAPNLAGRAKGSHSVGGGLPGVNLVVMIISWSRRLGPMLDIRSVVRVWLVHLLVICHE